MSIKTEMDAAILKALGEPPWGACTLEDRDVFMAGMRHAAKLCKANDADYSYDLITADINALEAKWAAE